MAGRLCRHHRGGMDSAVARGAATAGKKATVRKPGRAGTCFCVTMVGAMLQTAEAQDMTMAEFLLDYGARTVFLSYALLPYLVAGLLGVGAWEWMRRPSRSKTGTAAPTAASPGANPCSARYPRQGDETNPRPAEPMHEPVVRVDQETQTECLPRTVFVAPKYGEKYHLHEQCRGLRSARLVTQYKICQLCSGELPHG